MIRNPAPANPQRTTRQATRTTTITCMMLVLIAMLALASVAQAEITMTARVGFDGALKPGFFTPVTVLMSNTPATPAGGTRRPVDFRGRLRLETRSAQDTIFHAEVPIHLPPNSQKEITLYGRFPDMERLAVVSLLDGSTPILTTPLFGAQAASKPSILHPLTDRLVVVVQPIGSSYDLTLPRSEFLPMVERRVVPSSLPDRWIGYQGVDLLVLPEYPAGMLTSEQQKAIAQWVASGGRLLVTAGLDMQGLAASEIADILPVELLGTDETSASIAGQPQEPLSVTRVRLLPKARTIQEMTEANDRVSPFAVMGTHGLGEVVFWTARPSAQASMYPTLLALARQKPADVIQRGWNFEIRRLLNFEGLLGAAGKPPSILLILAILTIYYFMVGPLNFRYLYKRQKLEWAWISIPLIVAVFTVAIYTVGILTKGNETLQQDYTLLQGRLNEPFLRQTAWANLFSPSHNRREVRPGDSFDALHIDAPGAEWLVSWSHNNMGGALDRESIATAGRSRLNTMTTAAQRSLGSMTGSMAGGRIVQDGPAMLADDVMTEQWAWTTVEALGVLRMPADELPLSGEVFLEENGQLSGFLQVGPWPLNNAMVRIAPPSSQDRIAEYVLGDLAPGAIVDLSTIHPKTAERAAASPEGRVATVARNQQRFNVHMSRLMTELQAVSDFPVAQAMFYANPQRPVDRAVYFEGNAIDHSAASWLTIEIPLGVKAPETPARLGIRPILAVAGAVAQGPRFDYYQQSLSLDQGSLIVAIESPFPPGTAQLASLTGPGWNPDIPSTLAITVDYFDFAANIWRPFSVGAAGLTVRQASAMPIPAASGVGVVRLTVTRLVDPRRSDGSVVNIVRPMFLARFQP